MYKRCPTALYVIGFGAYDYFQTTSKFESLWCEIIVVVVFFQAPVAKRIRQRTSKYMGFGHGAPFLYLKTQNVKLCFNLKCVSNTEPLFYT